MSTQVLYQVGAEDDVADGHDHWESAVSLVRPQKMLATNALTTELFQLEYED